VQKFSAEILEKTNAELSLHSLLAGLEETGAKEEEKDR